MTVAYLLIEEFQCHCRKKRIRKRIKKRLKKRLKKRNEGQKWNGNNKSMKKVDEKIRNDFFFSLTSR